MHTMMLVAQAWFSLGSLHGAWQFNQVVKWLSKLRGWDMAGVRWCYLWALPSCHCWLSWGLLLGEIFDDASPVVEMNPRVTPDTFRLLVRVTNPLINPFLGVTIGVVGRIGGPKQCMQTIFRICNELDFKHCWWCSSLIRSRLYQHICWFMSQFGNMFKKILNL